MQKISKSRISQTFVLFLILIIATSCLTLLVVKPTNAQTQSFFIINADGNVSPSTPLIKQTGNIYTFTSDMDTTVFTVQKSNIIIDGDSHILTNGQISMLSVTNVTVQNLSITNTGSIIIVLNDTSDIEITNTTITSAVTPFGMIGGILIENSSSVTIVRNTIKSGMFGILLSESHHNSIVQNYLTDNSNGWGYYSAGIILETSSSNSIYDNNFINNDHGAEVDSDSVNTWDNGKVGNYWSDYQSKYPNATMVDSSGIGNTPYVINGTNIDHFPQMSQASIFTSTPLPTPISSVPEFPFIIVIAIIMAVLTLAVSIFKRKTR